MANKTNTESQTPDTGTQTENQNPQTDAGVAAAQAAASKLTALVDKKKLDLIKAAIGGANAEVRRTFDSLDEAKAVFEKAKAVAGDSLTARQQSDESFTDDNMPVVALLGTRIEGQNGQKGVNGAKAIVLFAIPRMESFAATEEGVAWLRKIAEKEASHVAFRELRDSDTVEEIEAGLARIPSDVGSMIASHTRGDSIDTAAFDAIWNATRSFLKANLQAAVFDGVPNKANVLKCLRSRAYAESEFGVQEKAGMFGYIGRVLLTIGSKWKDEKTNEPSPIDTTAIEEWLENRDTFILPERAAPQIDEEAIAKFDFGSL